MQEMSEQNAIKKQHIDMEMSYELPSGRQLQSLSKYFETLCQWAYNWLKDLPGLFQRHLTYHIIKKTIYNKKN